MTRAGEPAWAPGSFLTLLTVAERDELLSLGTTRRLPGGRHLLVEGRQDTQVEVIRQGHVKITTTVGGLPRLLAIRLPGDLVGELAAITGSGRIATVTTCGDVVSTVIRQAEFLHFVNRHPHVAAQVTAAVGRKLRWANDRRSEFSAFPVHVRLGRVLLEIATSCGEAVGDTWLIRVELSQTELASLVGAREDTVQRALRDLRREGLVRTGYRRITVLDAAALRALTEKAEWL
ncbi:Crp/Fnr family transcriptional regulator [Actinoplanes lobatus]|uniref:CRP-like cAMP-binding protein n=2 Tax=Actinoplanes TaxID=1865 RepID=A0A7W5FFK3_9ACTN|nr:MULTISPECIES: Crp/Fnr family transcriptional regulator [Actinoplanes]MBB3096447.1 CRP-like cAMP-binding protein [Actinoplanes campanulatus]MBB4754997.1 CRP-like cAMP-binding protein [Actinoplanes lobatus]GGN18204.1 Crp/Fnr family transcriptional regulator [Actinoplanes campanulatus]GGN82618.1 Crp/Fnr family transcriptional regulator [Actinoplanes lobatus]GID38513.1 Crp/Fnr family transcriptional regulator [Actinoplanes campanulatus]